MNAPLRIIGLLLALAVTFLALPLNAQSVYGQVWGHLISASGAPVPGAAVSLISVATGVRVAAKSDARGNITISNLAADLYQIEVRADGFKTVQGIIAVNADSIAKIDASLEVGDPNTLSQRSEAGVSVLKLDRTDVATLFDARALSNLPILDRNLTVFQLLVPSVSQGQLFIPNVQNPQGGVPVNLNGQHFSGSDFQLDGTENRDPLEGIVVINPTLGSVQEMKVTTQGYNAEFGQATAGVVTLQTRSGSNTWHGETFGYRRTGWGESVNPFAPAGVPPSKHQSGLPFTPSYRKGVCALNTDSNAPCRPNRVGFVGISGNREQYFTTTGGKALEGNDCILDKNNTPTDVCGVNPETGQSVPGPANGPWQRPGAGQIGNVGRNSFRGPSFFQSDIAVAKMIAITERTKMSLRVDAFNAFNKVNLGTPISCVDCDGGGSIGSLAGGATQRILQFGLRVDF